MLLNLRSTVFRACVCVCVCVCARVWVSGCLSFQHQLLSLHLLPKGNVCKQIILKKRNPGRRKRRRRRSGISRQKSEECSLRGDLKGRPWAPALWIKAQVSPIRGVALCVTGRRWCSSDTPDLHTWSNHANDNVDLPAEQELHTHSLRDYNWWRILKIHLALHLI